jgi:hypothetical protein
VEHELAGADAAAAAAAAAPAGGAGARDGAAPLPGLAVALPLDDVEDAMQRRLEALFEAMDTNHDGSISWEEFRDAVQRDAALAGAVFKPFSVASRVAV